MPEQKEKTEKKPHTNTVNVASLNKALGILATETKEFQAKSEGVISLLAERIVEMQGELVALREEVTVLQTPKKAKSIQKPEEHIGEKEVTPRAVPRDGLSTQDQINSMKTLVCLLPPNMVDEDGRQPLESVQAICGFPVSEEMMDIAYEQLGA